MDDEIIIESNLESLNDDPNLESKERMQKQMQTNKMINNATGLKNSIQSYKNNHKASNNKDLKNNSTSGLQPSSTKTLNRGKNSPYGKGTQMASKAAEKALESKGVPKEVGKKIVNSELGQKAIDTAVNKTKIGQVLNSLPSKEGNDEEALGGSTSATSNKEFKIAIAIIGIGLAVIFFIMMVIVIIPKIYLNSMGLGFLEDKIYGDDGLIKEENIDKIEEKLEDIDEEKLENALDNLDAMNTNIENNNVEIASTGQLTSFAYNKLKNENMLKISLRKKAKYNQASEEDLENFFGDNIFDLPADDKDVAINFYTKLYDVYNEYKVNLGVSLNTQLLMSTLYLESDDMIEVFTSNAKKYKGKKDINDFKYDKDWSNYKLKKDNSEHDIEVLAQAMVSVDENGYYSINEDKYYEFLRQFLEKKYYYSGKYSPSIEIEEGNIKNNHYKSSGIDGFPLKQGDSRWADYKLGVSSTATMEHIGCAVTSLTMIIRMSGVPVTVDGELTPDKTASKMRFGSGGGISSWADVSNVAPTMHYVDVMNTISLNKQVLIKKMAEKPSNYYYLLHVGLHGRGSAHHFVAVNYIDEKESEIHVYDPSRDVDNVFDKYDVYRILFFRVGD